MPPTIKRTPATSTTTAADTTVDIHLDTNLVSPTAVATMNDRISTRTSAIVTSISTLTITDAVDYADADLLLVRIRQSKKLAEQIFDEEVGTPILEPMRLALNSLYALRKKMTETPFEAAERTVKGKMAEWQKGQDAIRAEERRVAREEEIRRERAAEEQRRQTAEAERVAAQAKGAQARKEAEAVAARLRETQAAAEEDAKRAKELAIAAEKARPVVGVGSRVTRKKQPVVVDMEAFIKGVVEGEVPAICLMVNEEVMEEYWKGDRGLVSAWPGVVIEEKVSVGGR